MNYEADDLRREAGLEVLQILKSHGIELEKAAVDRLVSLAQNLGAVVEHKRVEVRDLEYQLREVRNGVVKRPWRWCKKYQTGRHTSHWCLESVPQPDNGVGDGVDRTVGIVLDDYWSKHPTPLMLFVQNAINEWEENRRAARAASPGNTIF